MNIGDNSFRVRIKSLEKHLIFESLREEVSDMERIAEYGEFGLNNETDIIGDIRMR